MAITINWPTKVISVPKADMTLIQVSPVEVRQLDLNTFRLIIADLQDDFEGMVWPTAVNHSPPVTVGGVELARVVELINGYTVTFEDGQYAVNLVGANSNIADNVNVNQVSVRASNSAGLVTSSAIEFGEYGGGVTIDVINGESGTIYPIGTERRPVNNVIDANLIANSRGFRIFFIKGDIILTSGDIIQGKTIMGENVIRTTITIDSAAIVEDSEINKATVTGTLDNNTIVTHCIIQNINYVNGFIENSVIHPGTIYFGGVSTTVHMLNCKSGVPGQATAILDFNGLSNTESPDVLIRDYSGGTEIQGMDSGGVASIDLLSGQVKIHSSNTNGTLTIRGIGKVIDEATGEYMVSGTYNGNLVLYNETIEARQLKELWQLQGLDKNSPMTVTPSSRTADNISQTITGDGETTTTVTRD